MASASAAALCRGCGSDDVIVLASSLCDVKILFIIDRSTAYREIIRSRVLPEASARPGVKVIVAASPRYEVRPADLPPGTRADLHVVNFRQGRTFRARLSYLLDKIFHSFSRDVACVLHPDSTLAQIRFSLLRSRGQRVGVKLLYARLLALLGLRPLHFARLAERWGHYPDFSEFLDRIKPDLIVYSNMMTGQMDCLRVARRKQIPLLLDIPSWDQPTSKGPITVQPDYVIAWSDEMKQDIVRLHDVPADRIHVCGVLYFDQYFDRPRIISRDEYCEKMQIPKNHKIVLYSLSRIKSCPAAVGFIEKLHSLVCNQRLGFPVTLIVRANPLDNVHALKKSISRADLIIQFPSGDFDANGSDWKPSPTESADRIAAIQYADVMVMIQSTMILDAACMNRPIINLSYDNNLRVDELRSVRRIFNFNHAQLYQQLNATWMVSSDEELEKALTSYLADPGIHASNRAKLIEAMTHYRDGQTFRRWVDFVVHCATTSAGVHRA